MNELNLNDYCAPGTKIKDDLIAVTEQLSLRSISFQPAKSTNRPPVIFVAGWVSQIEAWQEVLCEMTKDFHVYYVETRDKNSAVINGNITDYDVATIGNDLALVVDHLGFDDGSYFMFGSSLGATSIIDCCSHITTKPAALILVGTNAEFRFPIGGRTLVRLFPPRLYLIIRPYIKWYLRTFRLDVKVDQQQYKKYCRALDAADPWKLKKGAMALMNYTIWSRLPGNDVPSLIIGGSHDILHDPDNLKKIASGLQRGTYLDLKTNKATHSAAVVDHMRAFVSTP